MKYHQKKSGPENQKIGLKKYKVRKERGKKRL